MIFVCVVLFTLICVQFVLHKRLELEVGLCQNAIKTSLEWMKSMEEEQLEQDNVADRQSARIDRLAAP